MGDVWDLHVSEKGFRAQVDMGFVRPLLQMIVCISSSRRFRRRSRVFTREVVPMSTPDLDAIIAVAFVIVVKNQDMVPGWRKSGKVAKSLELAGASSIRTKFAPS